MTGSERRHQLIDVARSLFAERGYDGTAIEEIAARAHVSKPVVYEHFGGKEGLYAVLVDRDYECELDLGLWSSWSSVFDCGVFDRYIFNYYVCYFVWCSCWDS
jgi:AcrR family transcriptional regulator